MRRSPAVLLLLAALGAAGGCNRNTPTAPTPPPLNQDPVPPAATLTGLVVFVPESLVVAGASLAMRANGRYSDGTLVPVQPQWSVSPAAAADISPSGGLTARSPADVMVIARLAEFEAQVNVRVAPNYAGTWRGSWRRLECFGPRCEQGNFANPVVDLLITQTGTGRELSAVMLFGPWDGTRYALSGGGCRLPLTRRWACSGSNAARRVSACSRSPPCCLHARRPDGRVAGALHRRRRGRANDRRHSQGAGGWCLRQADNARGGRPGADADAAGHQPRQAPPGVRCAAASAFSFDQAHCRPRGGPGWERRLPRGAKLPGLSRERGTGDIGRHGETD